MFSRAEIQRTSRTYPPEFTLITAKISNKQNVRKSLWPTEMLLVELIMFFQPEHKKKQSKNRKGQIRNIFWS